MCSAKMLLVRLCIRHDTFRFAVCLPDQAEFTTPTTLQLTGRQHQRPSSTTATRRVRRACLCAHQSACCTCFKPLSG